MFDMSTPCSAAVSGMSCISPRAPLREIAAGLNPDSTSMTDFTSLGSTENSRAEDSMSSSKPDAFCIRAASQSSLARSFAGPSL